MKISLEHDLLKTEYIRTKCRERDAYAQNLYAALCNNRFFKYDEEWTCSWRYSGGLVAELIRNNDSINTVRDSMDYMDWYCSGIGADNCEGYVAESCVTSEIANDLLNLGWIIKPYPEDEILKQI